MAGFLIDTSEVHALAADIRANVAEVQPTAERIVAKTAHDIEATAEQIVPVETGLLKNSIRAQVSGLDAVVVADTEYAEYVELGTSRMAAEPYMGPAFDRHEPRLEAALGQLGERILR